MKNTSTGSASQAISRPLPGKRALLDRRAVEILDHAVRRLPREGQVGVHAGWPVVVVDIDEVGGPRQQRNAKPFGPDRRSFGLRLVEAGDEAACRRSPEGHVHGAK